MEKPIFEKECLLQKYPGKGGWTFAEIAGIQQNKNTPFGWVKVKGKIDAFEFSNFNLAPMRNGKLFMAVKAAIRKKIEKQAGDYVKIQLFADNSIFEIPEEIIDCLKYDQKAYEKFITLKERHQKEFIKWIYAAKKEETKAIRINAMMDNILKDEFLYRKKEL
ncbi:YdeI/OmpD-associated family protein [Flavobacterium cellulosilyticum]|uniref:DUF1905 domain-containing protein n=1 Tax=Flavobacterium cellulosilyticum TaxID=2541731 RepID=A0A4R5CDV3_9FLAO|nr:YdeI/OmpD-associated family protein [Flavobacterium cellulosilyticum]TDD97066.1 DUF1905 domain-containing protein [Flavobacterium cellulosilyticum]